MAKVISPLFSFDARGQIGKALVYSIWKGICYVRKYVIPANPNTPEQQIIRGYFATAVSAWQSESNLVKSKWNDSASKSGRSLSGFNFYIGKYISFLIDNSGTLPTVTDNPPVMS